MDGLFLFSHSTLLAQAAALGAQTVLTNPIPASESVRPQPSKAGHSQPETKDELTDAPLEDYLLHGDDEGDAGGEEAPQR